MTVVYSVIGGIVGFLMAAVLVSAVGVTGLGADVMVGVGAVVGFGAWVYSPLPNMTVGPMGGGSDGGWGWPD